LGGCGDGAGDPGCCGEFDGDTGAADEQALDIQGIARLSLAELRAAWAGTLPALFG
jgi:hypothetical protein